MTRAFAAMAVMAVAAAAGMAGCGGGGGQPSGVASLAGNTGRGVTTTTVSKLSVTQLYAKWAQCMRQHGVNMADPVPDAQGLVTVNLGGAGKPPAGTFQAADQACAAQHEAAMRADHGGKAPQKADPAKLLNFSKCMRAHGLPDFPDPSGNGLQISSSPGSDLGPNNPTFKKAQQACQSILGSPIGGERTVVGGGPGPGGGSGSQSGGVVTGG